jgi:hypothetical protein
VLSSQNWRREKPPTAQEVEVKVAARGAVGMRWRGQAETNILSLEKENADIRTGKRTGQF